MNIEAMKPYGAALLEYYMGAKSAVITVVRDDGYTNSMPAQGFFRQADALEVESMALAKCGGRVLDAGGGAGIHSLFLMDKGLPVTAIDILPEAVRIMRDRGIEDVRQIGILSLVGECFDTIIMMGHGIGMVENISGLDRFLKQARKLLNPGGQILLTSLDVQVTKDQQNLAYHRRCRDAGRYFGEIRMCFKYRNVTGPYFSWLQVDPETLTEHALAAGWHCEVLKRQADGNYLARLIQIYGKDENQRQELENERRI